MTFRVNIGSDRVGPRFMIIAGYIVSFLGIIFVIVALAILIGTLSFLPGSVSTTGTITHCAMVAVQVNGSSGGEACQPTISFRTQTGQQVTITPSQNSSVYHVGDTLPLRYHPNNPAAAHLDDFASTWLLPLIFGCVTLLCLFLGQICLRIGKRRRRAGMRA